MRARGQCRTTAGLSPAVTAFETGNASVIKINVRLVGIRGHGGFAPGDTVKIEESQLK